MSQFIKQYEMYIVLDFYSYLFHSEDFSQEEANIYYKIQEFNLLPICFNLYLKGPLEKMRENNLSEIKYW